MKRCQRLSNSFHDRLFSILFACFGAVGLAALTAATLRMAVTPNDLRIDRAFRFCGPVAHGMQQLVDQLSRLI